MNQVDGARERVPAYEDVSLALRAPCFTCDPILPALRFRTPDLSVLGLSVVLALSPPVVR